METSTLSISNYIDFIPFNTTDLAANRQGQLTARQMARIQEMYVEHKKWLKNGPWTMLLFWCSINFLIALFSPSYRHDVFNPLGLLAVFGGPTLLGLISYFISRIMNEGFAKQTKTRNTTGKVRKKIWHGRGITGYRIGLNKVQFECTKEFFDLIEEHQNYAFYYIRNMGQNMVISWEKF